MNATPPRILFLDDQPEMLDSLADMVRLIVPGADVRTYTHGLEAWRAIQQQSPDLLISDVNHPGKSIFEIVSKTRFPVIITTGMCVQKADFPAGRDVQILYKPFEFSEFKQAISHALNLP